MEAVLRLERTSFGQSSALCVIFKGQFAWAAAFHLTNNISFLLWQNKHWSKEQSEVCAIKWARVRHVTGEQVWWTERRSLKGGRLESGAMEHRY